MAETPVLQTDQLTKIFHHPFFWWQVRARAVLDLTVSIRRGEVFGLLGPNGSGKTTTIKLILGLLFPTRGQVAVFGRRPNDLSIKTRIGYLPEESYLYRFLDAEETLDFYGRLFGLPRHERRRRTEALLDLTGLRQERRRPINEFSKGMQRRIGIAQSLINDPEFVILDEPTAGLDPLGTREVKDLIVQLREKGKTVLLCSHLLADVEDVCDRVTILYGGRTQAEGPVREILRKKRLLQVTAPMSEETARAVGELIREREGPDATVDLAPPMERLEDVFLRVVQEAREKRVATSGADAATGRLDFLSPAADTGSLLERLSHEEPEASPAAGGSAPGPRSPRSRPGGTDALESLTAPGDEATPVEKEVADEAPTARDTASPTDRDLLRKLTGEEEGDSA
jgi:ABC-2 type transport system ATP-binding protein